MSTPPNLTPTMRDCLSAVKAAGGTITRSPGGYWYPGGSAPNATAKRWFGTTTVEALVIRGVLEHCDWRISNGRMFPVQSRLKENVLE